MKLKVKYVRDVPKLKAQENGNWIDLYTPFDVTIHRGEYVKIPLGVCMEIPKGYEAIIAPRSSTFERYGIIQTNGIGIIDETYNGDNDEWHFPVYELAYEMVVIPMHTRLCQFRLVPRMVNTDITIAITLGNEDRGGFGSTGK